MDDNKYHGSPCKLGHTIKYKSNNNCVECAKLWQKDGDNHRLVMQRYKKKHPTKDKEYYLKNKQKIKDQAKRWRETNKIHRQCSRFGISIEYYQKLLQIQDHKCAICHTTNPRGRGNWHIDHCHKTHKVRGLLCTTCNTGLGHFKDDPDIIRLALAYLLRDEIP